MSSRRHTIWWRGWYAHDGTSYFEAVESVIAQYDSDINDTYTTDEMRDEMSLIGNPNESIRRRIIFMGPTGQPLHRRRLRIG